MEATKAAFSQSGQYLRWYAVHDYYASIALVVATFTIFPFAILLIPFLTALFIRAGSTRVSTDVRSNIERHSKIPFNVVLLQAKTDQISIFALPFFSVLKIPERLITTEDPEDLAVIVKHELAHHRRHDTAKVIWISISVALLLFYSTSSIIINVVLADRSGSDSSSLARLIANSILVSVIIVLLNSFENAYSSEKPKVGWERIKRKASLSIFVFAGLFGAWIGNQAGLGVEPYSSVDPSLEVRKQTAEFWGVVIISCSVLMILILRGVCHRMEYLADLEAAEDDWDAHQRFWKLRASPKIEESAERIWVKIYNSILHPTNRQRYTALAENRLGRGLGLFTYTFIWSAACNFLILRAVTNGRSTFGEGALSITNDLGLLGMVLIFLVIGYGLHSMIALHGRTLNGKVLIVFLGYMIGTVIAFSSVYLFERSAFNLEHFRPDGTSDFFLLSAASFFPLLLVTCFAANFAKLNKFIAMILVFFCLLVSTVVAVGALMEDLRVSPTLAFAAMLILMSAALGLLILTIRTIYFALKTLKDKAIGA